MKKFKNIKTGNILVVKDEVAEFYTTSEQYKEVVEKPVKAKKSAE